MNNIPAGRLMTLDAFRGISIAAMFLVNNPGNWDHVYSQLLHARWVGCTFTDLIFPAFLFVAGVAMWFSFKHEAAEDRWTLRKKILRRSSLMFVVGLFISWFPLYGMSLDELLFAGVLQRIAISYVIASFICISFNRKWIAAVATLMLLAYWLLIVLTGAGDPYSRDVVFDQGIDLVAFRSCISSAVPIMIGYLVGSYIDRPRYNFKFLLTLIAIGVAMMLLGKLWSLEFPIIKSLFWSSSYVVYTVGISIVAFAICLWVIEQMGMKSWAVPFVVFGLNSLFLYALSIVLDKLTWMIKVGNGDMSMSLHEWIHQSVFQPWAGDINGSLLYAVCFVLILWLIAYGLYKKSIFVKI